MKSAGSRCSAEALLLVLVLLLELLLVVPMLLVMLLLMDYGLSMELRLAHRSIAGWSPHLSPLMRASTAPCGASLPSDRAQAWGAEVS